jgi:hypothetical protein
MTGAGSNVGKVFASMTSRAYVRLPPPVGGVEWFGEIVDFAQAGVYGVYAPNCMGIWCHPSDIPTWDDSTRTLSGGPIIRMRTMSSTKAASVPVNQGVGDGQTNQLALMRLGPSGGGGGYSTHCYGWTLAGTDQPTGPNGQPHSYNGLVDYFSASATFRLMKIMGVQGDWNSPPGETFQFSTYRTSNPTYEFLEINGFNEAGRQVGGGVGGNGASNVTYRHCNFHDSYVSGGPIFSGAGGPSGAMCSNVSVYDCWSHHNANHVIPNPGGKNFPALNHEGVFGSTLHDHPDLMMDNMATYQAPYVFIGNTQVNQTNFVINEPNWHPELGTVPGTNSAFWIQIPAVYAGVTNTQTTIPTVIKNGVTLTPVIRAPGAGWPAGVNPSTQFIVKT